MELVGDRCDEEVEWDGVARALLPEGAPTSADTGDELPEDVFLDHAVLRAQCLRAYRSQTFRRAKDSA